jgi:capsular polysaccharide export protein
MAPAPRPLHVYSGGFLNARIRRILALAGWRVTTGLPGAQGDVGIWGASPTAWRGLAVAARTGARVIRIEDAPFRSLFPGRMGEPPLGLMLDTRGAHYDATQPSDLEIHLATAAFDDHTALEAARHAIARITRTGLTKYAATRRDLPPPAPGYVLVIDQTRGDAALMGAGPQHFREMLAIARIENPGARILIKTHPETQAGLRPGHFSAEDAARHRAELHSPPTCPYALLEGATAVYTWSSQMGLEAILAGHRPRVFGQPFYAGWGLTQDETPIPRRTRRLSRAQLVQGALMDSPLWYDPYRDRLTDLSTVLDTLEAQARAWREDAQGYTAAGMRLWKRAPLRRFYGHYGPLRFAEGTKAARDAAAHARPLMVWAGKETPEHKPAPRLLRVEDGFLRSRGLGADLVPPLSLVADDLGIHYDPSRPSRLEALIPRPLAPDEQARAQALIDTLRRAAVTKYNIGRTALPALPAGHRILIPGQVEDDASIRLGCTGDIRTNRALLAAARTAHPGAVLIYKPHPDVEAGLRPGALPDAGQVADVVATGTHPAALLGAVDVVWTMTSLLGFEALLRGLPVTCLGAPFYAGWGLTTDLAPVPERRLSSMYKMQNGACETVQIVQIAHAALIAYPRYLDPVTGQPCPVEIAVERLATGRSARRSPVNRALAKAQGVLAGQSWLWRR